MRALELGKRVRRVRSSTTTHLDVRDLERLASIDGQLAHLKALSRRRDCARTVGWLRAWNEQHSIELSALHSRIGRGDVTEVNWIKSPAENPDTQGWYSNSTSA